MSIQFIITKLLVRLSGSKRITGLPRDKMLKQIRSRNKLNRFFIPGDGKFAYRDVKVQVEDLDGITEENRSGDFHCLAICHREKPKRAQRVRLTANCSGMRKVPLRTLRTNIKAISK